MQGKRVGRLITVAAARWSVDGALVTLGDAAPAMAPFLGQGMNCALEDCVCLADVLNGMTTIQRRGSARVKHVVSLTCEQSRRCP